MLRVDASVYVRMFICLGVACRAGMNACCKEGCWGGRRTERFVFKFTYALTIYLEIFKLSSIN